jgi:hypothetical protein
MEPIQAGFWLCQSALSLMAVLSQNCSLTLVTQRAGDSATPPEFMGGWRDPPSA